jgi:hypothetical protein
VSLASYLFLALKFESRMALISIAATAGFKAIRRKDTVKRKP